MTHMKKPKGNKMLGIVYGKLDAKTCIVSLLIISLITLVASL